MKDIVIIEPRQDVTAQEIVDFLHEQFQYPGAADFGKNPLVNAAIRRRRQRLVIIHEDTPGAGK